MEGLVPLCPLISLQFEFSDGLKKTLDFVDFPHLFLIVVGAMFFFPFLWGGGVVFSFVFAVFYILSRSGTFNNNLLKISYIVEKNKLLTF